MQVLLSCLLTIACFGSSSKDLTLEEKVGQILIVHFHGEEANDDAKTLLSKSRR
jgi:hypothetical protein